jgi:hypothetical protein
MDSVLGRIFSVGKEPLCDGDDDESSGLLLRSRNARIASEGGGDS